MTVARVVPLQLNPDVNPFQRSFVGEIRRIDEMARRVRFFSTQIEKEGLPTRSLEDSAPLLFVGPRVDQMRDELETKLNEHEARLLQMNESYATLSTRTRELQEARHVLRETAVFFDRASPGSLCGLVVHDADVRLRPLLANKRFAPRSTTGLLLFSPATLRLSCMGARELCSSTSSALRSHRSQHSYSD